MCRARKAKTADNTGRIGKGFNDADADTELPEIVSVPLRSGQLPFRETESYFSCVLRAS